MSLKFRTGTAQMGARLLCCTIVFFSLTCLAEDLFAQARPLRLSEPVDSVVSDLRTYIPGRMAEANVPGLSIALIRDNRVVWTEGFGVTSRWTGKRVTPETVFETASVSKVVTAYVALRLVDQGRLSLDQPIDTYLREPWLPPSRYAGLITMRHLLSHSSGLGDDVMFVDKTIRFEPGSSFFYSGVGFQCAQEIIEQVTGKSLEQSARALVFEPLGMSASSFTGRPDVMAHMANGHMSYSLPLLSFLVLFTVILVVFCVTALPLNRTLTGRWRPTNRLIPFLCIPAFVLTVALLYLVIGSAFPNLIWVAVACALVFLAGLILSLIAARRVAALLPFRRRRRGVQAVFSTVWMIVTFLILLSLAGRLIGPVPANGAMAPSAVGSLRASAPDLATFLIELARPKHLAPRTHVQIGSIQVSDSQDFSWGLGVGIQHSANGDALWQNGITFAFRSMMVIYPKQGHGVVVLTNSTSGLPVAYDTAERALGGKAAWKHF